MKTAHILSVTAVTRHVHADASIHHTATPGATVVSFEPTRTIAALQATLLDVYPAEPTDQYGFLLKRHPQWRGGPKGPPPGGPKGPPPGGWGKGPPPGGWGKGPPPGGWGKGPPPGGPPPGGPRGPAPWLFGVLPSVVPRGGGDLPLDEYCTSFMSKAASSLPAVLGSMVSSLRGSSFPKATITVQLPGKDRSDKNDYKKCIGGDGPEGGWFGGRPPPWGPGPPPAVVVQKGPNNNDARQCSAATASLSSSVSSYFSSVSSSRMAQMSRGERPGGRPSKTIRGGACITGGTYLGGSVPGIYPKTVPKTGGTAVPGVAPTTGVTRGSPRTTRTVTVTSYRATTATPKPWESTERKNLIGIQVHKEITACRQFPDMLTNDWDHVSMLEPNTKLDVNCWTISSLPGNLGIINGSNLWVHAKAQDCWLHEQVLTEDIPQMTSSLQYCQTPIHRVGGLQPQYSRQDCYDGPSLDAPSRNLGVGAYIDVACEMFGEVVRGNHTWIKASQNCYLPGEVFDDSKWYGLPLDKCA